MLKTFNDLNIIEEDDEDSFLVDSLLQTADEGDLEEMKDLLTQNNPSLHVNSHNKHQETALHFSSSSGHLDMVKYLLEMAADIDSKDKHLETALYWAARQGNVEVVECLVEKGAQIDIPNELRQTALIAAVKYGRMDMVEVLCRLKINVNYADNQGETIAHCIAWMNMSSELCDIICNLPGLFLDAKNKNHETPLHIAAGRGNTACLLSLLEHGADVNCIDKRGSTPLHLACHCQHINVVKQLFLFNKINLNSVDQNGDTPLHVVSQSGLLKVVQMLCQYGCHVDAANKSGRTPLHTSAKLGHTEVVRCLLLSGASINYPYKNNITAKMMAVARGKNDTADLLGKLTPEKKNIAIKQLTGVGGRMKRVKLKVFGCSGVGKSKLIQALQTGFFGKFFKRKSYITSPPPSANPLHTSTSSTSSSFSSIPSILNHESKNNETHSIVLHPSPTHAHYTRGIHVQTCNISGGVGELSVWEFSGYEAYFQLYDKFIGDVNCIHMVCFDPFQSHKNSSPKSTSNNNHDQPPPNLPFSPFTNLSRLVQQFKMINFWLNFLKSRIPASEPIGKEGHLHTKAKVVLVGIIEGLTKTQMASFEEGGEMFKQLQELCLCMKEFYKMDLEVHPRVFIVDPTYATSLKSLKTCLFDLKQMICQILPTTSGFTDATIAALPAWRDVLSGYPVVTWNNFIEYVRSTVNLLCSQDHLKELIYKLQIAGEVIFIETKEHEDDLVVLDVDWLCCGVLGALLADGMTSVCRRSGFYSTEDFQFMFPDYEAGEVLHLLQALNLCSRCDVRENNEEELYEGGNLESKKKSLSVLELNSLPSGDHKDFASEYEIPCLNFVRADEGIWNKLLPQTAVNTMYAGSRYKLMCPYCHSNLNNSLWRRQKNTQLNDSGLFNSTSSLNNNTTCALSRNDSLPSNDGISEHDLELPPTSMKPSKNKTYRIINPSLPSYIKSHLADPSKAEFVSESECAYNQLSHVFTRIQHELRKQQSEEGHTSELEQYNNTCKYSKDDMEVLVSYEDINCECGIQIQNHTFSQHHSLVSYFNTSCQTVRLCHCCLGCIEVKCRGPSDMANELFELLKSIKYLVETSISMCCPSSDVCHQVMSSSQLTEHQNAIVSFSQKEILESYLHSGSDAILCYEEENGEECVETLLDLLAFGNSQVFSSLSLATDLPIHYLNLQTKRKLAFLLDPSDQTGCDWCMLAIMLGFSNQMPYFESNVSGENSFSKTNRIFMLIDEINKARNEEEELQNNGNDKINDSYSNLNKSHTNSYTDEISTMKNLATTVTIGTLISKLQRLGRHDAADVIYNTCALTLRPDAFNENDDDDVYNGDLNINLDDSINGINGSDMQLNDQKKNGFSCNEMVNISHDSEEDSFVRKYKNDENKTELHKDDESINSEEGHDDGDMYIDDFGDYGGGGVFDSEDLKLSERGDDDGFM